MSAKQATIKVLCIVKLIEIVSRRLCSTSRKVCNKTFLVTAINTIGVEVDGCAQLIPSQLPPQVTDLLKTGGLSGLSTPTKYLDALGPALGLTLPPGGCNILELFRLGSLQGDLKCEMRIK